MNSFKGLRLNGKYYAKDWILNHFENLSSKQYTENERRVLIFCGQWLSGSQEFIVQTSGSTGQSKLIHLKRAQMSISARMTAEALHLEKGERAFVCLSCAYIGGIMMLVRGLVLELELTVVDPARVPIASSALASDSAETIESFELASFVPLQLQAMLSAGGYTLTFLNQMKAILVGGAPISFTLFKQLQKVEAPIYQTFGMTETVSHIALRRLNGPNTSECYTVLPGVEIGRDARGCLTIKSRLTNNRTIITNDLVELQSNNDFRWLGRLDNVINSGGVKVQAEKVEKAVAETLDEIEQGTFVNTEFFVAPLPDEKFGQVVAVIFEASTFSQPLCKKILEKLSQKLNKYELPKAFYFEETLMRTQTGKIDRNVNLKKILQAQTQVKNIPD